MKTRSLQQVSEHFSLRFQRRNRASRYSSIYEHAADGFVAAYPSHRLCQHLSNT